MHKGLFKNAYCKKQTEYSAPGAVHKAQFTEHSAQSTVHKAQYT